MATNLNLSDMETCYKAFRREIIQQIEIEEDRFGFEPEITAKIAAMHCRVYEVGISYYGRTYDDGKKIGWRDGVRAIFCIAAYSPPGHPVRCPAGEPVRRSPHRLLSSAPGQSPSGLRATSNTFWPNGMRMRFSTNRTIGTRNRSKILTVTADVGSWRARRTISSQLNQPGRFT